MKEGEPSEIEKVKDKSERNHKITLAEIRQNNCQVDVPVNKQKYITVVCSQNIRQLLDYPAA